MSVHYVIVYFVGHFDNIYTIINHFTLRFHRTSID